MSVRVGVNGYGTIGRRVAWAVSLQDDMELVGIAKKSPDISAVQAYERGINVYALREGDVGSFEKAGVEVRGTLDDLLARVDVVVDSTPEGVGASYKPLYESAGLRQVFQGGEKPEVAEASFSSLCNYEESLGRASLRVVSCNTTGLLRVLCTLNRAFGVESAEAVIIRRAADPREVRKGPINSIELKPVKPPSHHAADAVTVAPWLRIHTVSVVVPTTLMHLHHLTVRLRERVSRGEVVRELEEAPRIILLDSSATGISGTAGLMDAARSVRPFGDVPENVIFSESLSVDERTVSFFQAIHQESIVVPENIDAIRAVTRAEEDGLTSIRRTDKNLGITKRLV